MDAGLREAHRNRRPVAVALQTNQPASRLQRQIGRRPRGMRPILSVRRHGNVDQLGMFILEVVVSQPPIGHRTGIERLDQHIGRRYQSQKVLPSRFIVQVDHHAALAQAHRGPVERALRLLLAERRQIARWRTPGRLHLDHFGPHVGEHAAGHLGSRSRQIDHAHSAQQGARGLTRHFCAPIRQFRPTWQTLPNDSDAASGLPVKIPKARVLRSR